jgi:hypothetical protein
MAIALIRYRGGGWTPLRAQVSQAFDNLETLLREARFELSQVIRLNYYAIDVDAFLEAGNGAGTRLASAGCRPASTLLGVQRLALPTLMVEIEATAVASPHPPRPLGRGSECRPIVGLSESPATTRNPGGIADGMQLSLMGGLYAPVPRRR